MFIDSLDWNKVKKQSEKIILIYSDDDPYVKPYHAEYIGSKLGISPVLLKGQKHFNLEAGEQWKSFPELLKLILASID